MVVEAGLGRLDARVVVGADAELEVAAVVAGDVDAHGDRLSLRVRAHDRPRGVLPSGLVRARVLVPSVAADAAAPALVLVLVIETPAEALVVIVVDGRVIAESPGRRPRGRVHQPPVAPARAHHKGERQ